MKKKVCNHLFVLVLTLCLFLGSMASIYAASIYISASTGSVAPGGSFSVTVGGNVTGRVNISVSNGSASTGSVWIENSSESISITAGSSGTVTVTASPVEGLSDENGDPADASSRSVSVSIVQPQKPSNNGGSSQQTEQPSQPVQNEPVQEEKPVEDKRSKNNDLSSLSIDKGTMSPKFSASETEYTVTLPADAEKIKINAKAADDKATVSGAGEKSVKAGKNVFTIEVTAENGSTKTYKITANVDEKPLVYTTYGDKKLGVVRNLDGVKAPSGFEETKTKIDGKEVTAWKNDKIKKTIVYMTDEENNKGFYIVEDGKATTSFTYRKMLGRQVYIIDIPEDKQKMTGMKLQDMTIDEVHLKGWVFEDPAFENYALIYVMDMDGKLQYYQYEKTQNTLQLYSNAAVVTQKKYEEQLSDAKGEKNIWMIGTGVASVVAVISLGFSFYLMKKKNGKKTNNQSIHLDRFEKSE